MKVRHWISTSLLAITLSTSTGIFQKPVLAQNTPSTCETSLSEAVNTIATGRDARVTSAYSRNLAELYSSYPAGKSVEVTFLIGGRSTGDILLSNQFMTILATRIISGCNLVGMVTFGMNNGGWQESFGLVNGQVINFTCLEIGAINRAARWGERYCD